MLYKIYIILKKMFNILVLSLICMMAFNSANSAYSSSHRYAPQYDYGGGAYAGAGAGAGAFSGVGGFDPFTFVFGNQNEDETFSNTFAQSTDDAFAKAEASLLPDDDPFQQVFANNLAVQDQIRNSILAQNAYYANRAGSRHRRPSGYASYAGGAVSVGPNGVHHVTFVHPSNPNSPNVDTRGHRGNGGYFGISSSAYSTNVNGKHHGGSQTLINDNGKVTAHRTHNT
ncbi:uncharacterized protein LOC129618561 isoform X2 [Condylostylus longicornis]|uniref:uncharacterized protein LOC129618561 isoform X2 n=1 Tax=Condylostylus longicornis TaxID=2530218 RepID=UPI00244E534A|nr:uncharacterized protein LOC129618561 isoform X2 [Condylostylus longicornis]